VGKDWKLELWLIYEGQFWQIEGADRLESWTDSMVESLTWMAQGSPFGGKTGEAYRDGLLGYAAETQVEGEWVRKVIAAVEHANEGRELALEAYAQVQQVTAPPVTQTLLQWGWDKLDFTTDHLARMQAEADEAAQQEAARQQYLAVCDHLNRSYYRMLTVAEELPHSARRGAFPDPPVAGEEDDARWAGLSRRVPGAPGAVYAPGYIPGLPGGGVYAPGQDPTPAGVHPAGYTLSHATTGSADSAAGAGTLPGAAHGSGVGAGSGTGLGAGVSAGAGSSGAGVLPPRPASAASGILSSGRLLTAGGLGRDLINPATGGRGVGGSLTGSAGMGASAGTGAAGSRAGAASPGMTGMVGGAAQPAGAGGSPGNRRAPRGPASSPSAQPDGRPPWGQRPPGPFRPSDAFGGQQKFVPGSTVDTAMRKAGISHPGLRPLPGDPPRQAPPLRRNERGQVIEHDPDAWQGRPWAAEGGNNRSTRTSGT